MDPPQANSRIAPPGGDARRELAEPAGERSAVRIRDTLTSVRPFASPAEAIQYCNAGDGLQAVEAARVDEVLGVRAAVGMVMMVAMIMTRNAAMRSQRMTVLLTPEAKSVIESRARRSVSPPASWRAGLSEHIHPERDEQALNCSPPSWRPSSIKRRLKSTERSPSWTACGGISPEIDAKVTDGDRSARSTAC